jgi:hypothetical protein
LCRRRNGEHTHRYNENQLTSVGHEHLKTSKGCSPENSGEHRRFRGSCYLQIPLWSQPELHATFAISR